MGIGRLKIRVTHPNQQAPINTHDMELLEMVEYLRDRKKQLVCAMFFIAALTLLFMTWNRRVVIIKNRTTRTLVVTASLEGKGLASVQLSPGERRTVPIFAIPGRGEEASIIIAGPNIAEPNEANRGFRFACGYETLTSSKNYLVILTELPSGKVELGECESFSLLQGWLYLR